MTCHFANAFYIYYSDRCYERISGHSKSIGSDRDERVNRMLPVPSEI